MTCTRLHFVPVMGGAAIPLNDSEGGTNLKIQTLRCYISAIRLMQDNREVWREPGSYHLLDASEKERMDILLATPAGIHYNKLVMQLGIDSATSASGAHSGDLDPANGMYWAWQSGYVNFKLEGVSPQSTARKHQFHFHLGGYQAPYAAMQEVKLTVRPAEEIVVRMALDEFLNGIDFAKLNSIMIPGEQAAILSKKVASIFHTL